MTCTSATFGHPSLWPPSQPFLLSLSISGAQGSRQYHSIDRQRTPLAGTPASKTLPAHARARGERALAAPVRRPLDRYRPRPASLPRRWAATPRPLHARHARARAEALSPSSSPAKYRGYRSTRNENLNDSFTHSLRQLAVEHRQDTAYL
jgi:hypothetical protein